MLDYRFFERVATTNYKECTLESYKAVYARSTMVLFSRKTGTPLAALTLKADDVGCLSMLTGRPSPKASKEPYFQGMLNLPDQTFSFTISNLSDKGMINFNILHTPHRVSEVDPGPGYGINEVNELSRNQSYTIQADQRNNRKMVLAGKTKIVEDPQTFAESEVAVTVKETEEEEKSTGLYFYLSVVADKACKETVEKFAEGTVWKVVPGFVRRVARSPPPPMRMEQAYGGQMIPGLGDGLAPVPDGAPHYVALGATGPPPPVATTAGGIPQTLFASTGAPPSMIHRRLLEGGNQSCHIGERTHRTGTRQPASNSQGFADYEDESEQIEEATEFEASPTRFAGSVDVGSTQAAELKYGQRVTVRSGFTGHDYAYEHCSEPTVLCMSIWEGMKFLALSDITKELEEEVQEWVKNEGKALIESLNAVFKSETCVIDLESEADTIICTCGHQCINHANISNGLRRCPMCRSPIVAFVKANGILVA